MKNKKDKKVEWIKKQVKADRGTWGAWRPTSRVKGNAKKEISKRICRGKDQDFYCVAT